MKNLFWSAIFRCNAHRKFNRVFDKMEKKGVALFIKGAPQTPSESRAIRNYIKNLSKFVAIYDRFMKK